jgi:nicotinate-nucleotide--dimethylbenzimidazole phosphoribosyltransferase
VSGDALRRKIRVIGRAIEVNEPQACDPLDVLAKVGGYEIGFLAGVMLGAASKRGAVIIDGFISTAAALIAVGLDGSVRDYMLAGHRSAEPGHDAALAHLGLRPLLDLKMRLGEGTGAALALQAVDAALALHAQMATFAEAGVSGAEAEGK